MKHPTSVFSDLSLYFFCLPYTSLSVLCFSPTAFSSVTYLFKTYMTRNNSPIDKLKKMSNLNEHTCIYVKLTTKSTIYILSLLFILFVRLKRKTFSFQSFEHFVPLTCTNLVVLCLNVLFSRTTLDMLLSLWKICSDFFWSFCFGTWRFQNENALTCSRELYAR